MSSKKWNDPQRDAAGANFCSGVSRSHNCHGQSMDENRGASEDQSKSLTSFGVLRSTRQQIVSVTKLVLEVNRSAACEGVEQPACIKSSDPQWSLQHRGQSAPPAATSREPDVRSRLGALQR